MGAAKKLEKPFAKNKSRQTGSLVLLCRDIFVISASFF